MVFGLQTGSGKLPCGRTRNGKSPATVRVESVTWYVQQISLSGTEMSLAGQWDAVNGEVLRCLTVQALEHHDHHLNVDDEPNNKILDLSPLVTVSKNEVLVLFHQNRASHLDTEIPLIWGCSGVRQQNQQVLRQQ